MPASPCQHHVAYTPSLDGGCARGVVRFRMHERRLYVYSCQCKRCQHETGGPFAHHAMIEFSKFSVLQGKPEYVPVPTDSGGKHWVARCPARRTATWNEDSTRKAVTRYVRVGTLDEPAACLALAHIYVKSKQHWVVIPADAPAFQGHYDASKTWRAESLARYAKAKTAQAADGKPTPAKTRTRVEKTKHA